MEQTPHSPGRSPELPSVSPPSAGEMGGVIGGPEVQVGGAVEHRELRGETAPMTEQTVAPPVVLPTPVIVPPSDDNVATTTQGASDDTSLPTVAGDDDLIEKEWVEKTKKVLAETKDDPYKREQEVTRIQADYLSKRYGRELGSRSES